MDKTQKNEIDGKGQLDSLHMYNEDTVAAGGNKSISAPENRYITLRRSIQSSQQPQQLSHDFSKATEITHLNAYSSCNPQYNAYMSSDASIQTSNLPTSAVTSNTSSPQSYSYDYHQNVYNPSDIYHQNCQCNRLLLQQNDQPCNTNPLSSQQQPSQYNYPQQVSSLISSHPQQSPPVIQTPLYTSFPPFGKDKVYKEFYLNHASLSSSPSPTPAIPCKEEKSHKIHHHHHRDEDTSTNNTKSDDESEDCETSTDKEVDNDVENQPHNELLNSNNKSNNEYDLLTQISEKSNHSSYVIQIDGINEEVNENLISDIFSIVGNLKSTKIVEDLNKYAIVEYYTEESAIRAIKKFNGTKLKGSKMTVSWSNIVFKVNKIVLYNLPYNIEKEKILNICSVIGELESIEIEREEGRSRCALVFEEEESIKTALDLFQDSIIDGLQVEVIEDRYNIIILHTDYKVNSNGNGPISSSSYLRQVVVEELPPSPASNLDKTKETINIIKSAPTPLQQYNINSNPIYEIERPLIINNFTCDEVKNIFDGYEIKSMIAINETSYEVNLSNEEMTNTAMKELAGKEYNHKIIALEWGNEKRVKKQLNTVFVGCLSEAVSEDDIRDEFSKIGEIHSVKVFRQKVKGNSPDYAYVNFVNPEDIKTAVETLNGINIKGRFITVQYPKKK